MPGVTIIYTRLYWRLFHIHSIIKLRRWNVMMTAEPAQVKNRMVVRFLRSYVSYHHLFRSLRSFTCVLSLTSFTNNISYNNLRIRGERKRWNVRVEENKPIIAGIRTLPIDPCG